MIGLKKSAAFGVIISNQIIRILYHGIIKLMRNLTHNMIYPFHLLYKYHYLIYVLALKELKIRYRGSIFGFLWSMLNPLLNLLVYTFLFVVIFKNTAHAYPVYFFSGILPWNWFSSSILEATDSILAAGSLVTKSTLPAEIVVITKIVSNLINYLLSIPILFIFLMFFHIEISLIVLLLPIIIFIQFFITTGIAFFPATWNVFYRDVRQIIQNLMQLFFFSIPIMYFDTQLPSRFQKLIYLNPVAYLIKCYHDIFYDNIIPKPELVMLLFFISVIVYIIGFNYFHSKKDLFAEYI